MIKIKAKYDKKNENFNANYDCKNSNTLEHIATIWLLIDKILENDKNINENDIVEIIKNRNELRNYNNKECE